MAPDGIGHYRHYAGGSIYWSPATGVHESHGAIRALWAAGALGRTELRSKVQSLAADDPHEFLRTAAAAAARSIR